MADIFIKFEGIEGESVDKDHKGEIEILSWSWGVSNQGSQSVIGGGGGAGKAVFQDIHFVKVLDKSSPKLMLRCASGKHIKDAQLTLRRNQESEPYLKIKLTDILVSSYQHGGSGSERPYETISLAPSTLHMEYYRQSEDGSVKLARTFGYDLKKGTKI